MMAQQTGVPRESRRIRLLLNVGFGLLILLIVVVGVASTLTARFVDQTLDQVAQIAEVLSSAERVRLALIAARGHESDLLANYQELGFDLAQTAYVEPFQNQLRTAYQALDEMREVDPNDDPAHLAEIDTVAESLRAYEDGFAGVVAILRERGDLQSGQASVVYGVFSGVADEARQAGDHLVEARARETTSDFLAYLISFDRDLADSVNGNARLLSDALAESDTLGAAAIRLDGQVDTGLTVFADIVSQNAELTSTIVQLERNADGAQVRIEDLLSEEQSEQTQALVALADAENFARDINLILLVATVALGLSLAIVIGRSVTAMTGDLAEARFEAEEASRLKSEFLATMSHELRTPLNAVIGYSQILMAGIAGELNEKQHENQDRILKNGTYLMELINDILDLSKIEAGRMEIKPREFGLEEWMLDIKRKTEGLAEEKGLKYTTYRDPALPGILYADVGRLEQIAMNLLSNAIKFTDEGEVEFRVEAVGSTQWTIRVRDTGIGIAPHAQEFIFDNFRQVDSSYRRKHGGSGLGLAIVRNIVTMMGGTIRVQSEVGKGSTFSAIFPLRLSQRGTGPLSRHVPEKV